MENIETNEVVTKKVEKEPQTCPLKHSNFFLTINSQKDLRSMDIEEKNATVAKFQQVVRQFFNGEFQRFIKLEGSKIGEKYGMPRNAPRTELEKRIVNNIKIDFVFEMGDEQGRLHSHAMICISKRGLDTKLDYSGVKKYFDEQLGYDIHFKSQLFRDSKSVLQDYINKKPLEVKN